MEIKLRKFDDCCYEILADSEIVNGGIWCPVSGIVSFNNDIRALCKTEQDVIEYFSKLHIFSFTDIASEDDEYSYLWLEGCKKIGSEDPGICIVDSNAPYEHLQSFLEKGKRYQVNVTIMEIENE